MKPNTETDPGVETRPIPGTRAARRVLVKHKPAGPGPKRRAMWDEGHATTRTAMAAAAASLVTERIKPTLAAVVDRMVADGGTLSIATAGRRTDALAAARKEWELHHGRVPEWHRGKAAGVEEAGAVDDVPPAPPGPKQDDAEGKALKLAEARYKRTKEELDKTKVSRNRLAVENAELREQVRRLELALSPVD